VKKVKVSPSSIKFTPLFICEETGDLYRAYPSRARNPSAIKEKTTTVTGSALVLSNVKGLELDQEHLEVKRLASLLSIS